ncbi:MAG TPA: type II toxin-antitoxin system ParD family antitoxin [Roseomonas sp.]|nr:type II toxin-antitoxin system ParD family antitoxin [Roseomonas sp.]
MTTVTLTPEQERFAADAVAQGRFRDVDDVVRTGFALLQQAEAELAAFVRSLEEAEAEGEREGFVTIEELERDMDAVLKAAAARRV